MDELDFGFWLGLLKDEGIGFLGLVLWPTLLGFLTGVVIAAFGYAILRITKLINADTPCAAKILVPLWLFVVLALALAIYGFHFGVNQGARHLVTEGKVAEQVVPQVGDEIAAFVLRLDGALAHHLDGAPVPTEGGVVQESLDAAAFLDRARRGGDLLVEQLLPEYAGQAKGAAPILADGIGEKVFDWFVNKFGEQMLRDRMAEADRAGIVSGWLDGLQATASEHGVDGKIHRKELGKYTVESLIITAIGRPFESIAKVQRTVVIVLLVFVFAVPTVVLLFLRRRRISAIQAGENNGSSA